VREKAGYQLPSGRLTYVGAEGEEDAITDCAPGRQADRCI